MKKLIKDASNNVAELISLNGFIPEGWTEVPAEELEAEELALVRRDKMIEVRAKRDAMMKEHDKQFTIAQKTSASTVQLVSDYQILLDIPEAAETAINAITVLQDIRDFDAFTSAGLAGDYE